ncbi:small RNA 2'-O-methyltransferase isoform X2 [Denticeps clupeoides]|uniref:small RNA 2'-O-methyltransferase isoform X2 n=1 Tax=Denticeps clupeoides TaxID=299321 RepID=UPI0010A541AF|nr:small RNA 2'-O-methyltransferase isoform X2 [Denticeps clupeoides]
MFSPPLYKQRYEFVVEFVKSNDVKSVLDVGCSNLSLLRRLRFLRHVVELLVGLDTDASAVRRSMFTLSPFPGDYLQPGERPLAVELYHGSVVERDPCTRGFDLVTCVELVEHLPLPDVDVFSAVLFGYMAPASVIVSTPNAEFNPLLPGVTAFRHTDHKFEWTRAQFQAWARDACRTFGYAVEFTGVGEAPPTHAHVGFCTQIGVFRRAEGRGAPADWRAREEPSAYKLLYRVVYPSLRDNNVMQRALVNEVLCAAELAWRARQEEAEPGGGEPYRLRGCVCVPLRRIWSCPRIRSLCRTLPELRRALLDGRRVTLTPDGHAVVLRDVPT